MLSLGVRINGIQEIIEKHLLREEEKCLPAGFFGSWESIQNDIKDLVSSPYYVEHLELKESGEYIFFFSYNSSSYLVEISKGGKLWGVTFDMDPCDIPLSEEEFYDEYGLEKMNPEDYMKIEYLFL